jgi:hypothetical protein
MPNLIDDDELDRQLREAVPYIDDGGFTSRVMQSLPPRSAGVRLRGTILMTMTALACGLAYILSGRGGFVNGFVIRVSELPFTWLLALTFAAGILVGAFGLTAALFKAREPVLITGPVE